jgi:predicted tellurium resistance membrane protein TerC
VEFASGYVLEQSLSVDNLFVFLILFDYFKIPKDKQDRILTYGLGVAILLRGLFIGVGFAALESFHDILLVFAFVLLYSSYNILFADDATEGENEEEEDLSKNFVVMLARKFFKTTDKLDGDRFVKPAFLYIF